MSRAYLKLLILIILILNICSGCKQSNLIIGDNFWAKADNMPQAVKYKNGAILLRNNNEYDIANRKSLADPQINVKEIKFGPKNLNFGN